jgi:hypothetical protein
MNVITGHSSEKLTGVEWLAEEQSRVAVLTR